MVSGQPDEPTAGSGIDWDDVLDQLTDQPDEPGWVTLEEASTAAGVARSTLRSWYRAGHIPSRMVMGPHGPQRMVPLDAVLDRALRSSRLRRQIEHGRSLAAEVDRLRQRVEVMERLLGLR
jgi:predicted site-specific integrase-resolvase